ncbi:MAG: glycosyltransferase family 2 protein [Pseudomonadota bacterium]
MDTSPRYSFVLPVYNERDVLPLLFERLDALSGSLDGTVEFLMVDDGSNDGSRPMLQIKAQGDPRYRVVGLSRNFGHQVAITAGIDQSRGEAVIIMDADLQDPPEVALDLIRKWREGFAVVAAKRDSRAGEHGLKLATARLFYRVLASLTPVRIEHDVGDFRLMDRKVVEAFKRMREQDRFVRGMVSWLGFEQTTVPYSRAERAAGSTKYPLSKMLRLATNGIIGFSDIPLRVALWFGALVSVLAIVFGIYVVAGWIWSDSLVQGWASTVVILSFLGGVNLMMIGVAGLYIGRIYEQVKNRPLYLLDETDEDATR